MAIQVWNGTGYSAANLDGQAHAYVWDGTQFVEVWAAIPLATEA